MRLLQALVGYEYRLQGDQRIKIDVGIGMGLLLQSQRKYLYFDLTVW